MFGWWRRKMESAVAGFDKKTESIENHATQVDREIERIEHETRDLFNRTVAETAAKIDTLKDPEDRELVRALALQEFQSISLSGGAGDLSRLVPKSAQAESALPRYSI